MQMLVTNLQRKERSEEQPTVPIPEMLSLGSFRLPRMKGLEESKEKPRAPFSLKMTMKA